MINATNLSASCTVRLFHVLKNLTSAVEVLVFESQLTFLCAILSLTVKSDILHGFLYGLCLAG